MLSFGHSLCVRVDLGHLTLKQDIVETRAYVVPLKLNFTDVMTVHAGPHPCTQHPLLAKGNITQKDIFLYCSLSETEGILLWNAQIHPAPLAVLID